MTDAIDHRRPPAGMDVGHPEPRDAWKRSSHPGQGRSMVTANAMCPICSGPMLLGAYRILEHGAMAHLNCRASPHSSNRWPAGIRDILCLRCGRAFERDSRVQRLCRACRSRVA